MSASPQPGALQRLALALYGLLMWLLQPLYALLVWVMTKVSRGSDN